jgi:hypothetical protein
MSDKKNIDNLFREAFKDFEASPDPALWDKISSQLNETTPIEKKKGEGIVFSSSFFKIAGIAAALLLLFTVGSQFIDSSDDGINPENQTTSTSKKDSDINGNSSTDINETTKDIQVTGTKNSSEQQRLQDENTSQNSSIDQKERIVNRNNTDTKNINNEKGSDKDVQRGNALRNDAVAQQNGTNTNTKSAQSSNPTNYKNGVESHITIKEENAVANTNSSNNQKSAATNSSIQNSSSSKSDDYRTTVAQNSTNASNSTKNNLATTENKNTATKANTNSQTNANAVAQNDVNTTNSVKNDTNKSANTTNTVAQNDSNTTTGTSNSTKNADTTTNAEVKNTTEAVAEVKKDEIKKSLLDVINELHELEKDTDVIAEATPKKWTISPNASPVYYNSLANGSPIDETFADNTKSGDVNLSFGINVGYDVSSRLTIRSGIHKVDYSYSTRDVALAPSINGNSITTIAFKQNASTFEIKDRQANIGISTNQNPQALLESSIQAKEIEGNLNQRMSYIEVPVELKYAVIDKKIGVNVIGGVSTLLLTKNSVVLDSPQLTTELGEATNVNDLSFSTNIGIGIDYKLSKQLEFNLEPMLKYQINTFSGNTGNFKPYSVGVYTGVSFRF